LKKNIIFSLFIEISNMSNQANFCMVYYYVPEDHDDPEVPNAFGWISNFIIFLLIFSEK